ncbi:MAG: hypothetical protein EOO06_13320 [Chitinophagaceae bacterium]|nr:MAG: hypothetical protein EOO06_13320 [Chitinophagaceae bacterium]
MNKIFNIFNGEHSLYAYRWLVMSIVLSLGAMAYFDHTGDGMFMFNQQQQWNSSGPGYHK